jgi:hypothetical protein
VIDSPETDRPARAPVIACELWAREMLGIFSIRLEDGEVWAIQGPIPLTAAVDCDPAGFDYDEGEAAIARARDTPEQFVLLEQWLKGGVEYRPRPLDLDLVGGFLAKCCFRLRQWLRLR